MKKVLSLLLIFTFVMSLTSCGGKSSNNTSDKKNDASKYKVAMICDSSISDGGWGAACYNAMVSACEKKNWEYAVTDSISQDEYYNTIVSYCSLGYNMIYAPGNQYSDAVLQASEEYPDIAFALLNGAETTPEKAANKNVTSLLPNAEEIGWIAGALAGLVSETGKIAFIGGMELDTTLGKYKAYKEAAEYVGKENGKEITCLDTVYAGSFSASDKGIEFAKAFIDKGADVFFGDASAVDSGARQAIDEENEKNGAVKIYDIAQPADLLGQNDCIIGSQVTDNSAMLSEYMTNVEEGKLGGDVIYGTIKNGALSAGKLNDLLPNDIKEKYNSYIEDMKNGTFMK